MKKPPTVWFCVSAMVPVQVAVEVFADLNHLQAHEFALDVLDLKGLEHYPSHSGFFVEDGTNGFAYVFPIPGTEPPATGPGEHSNTDGDVRSDNLTGRAE
jgi:hypothetical protein